MQNLAALMSKAAEDYAAKSSNADTGEFFRAVGYDLPCEPQVSANRLALMRTASLFSHMFRLPAPDTPGLFAIGALVDPRAAGIETSSDRTTSLSGAGLSPIAAFEGCVGEGIEYLSQFMTGDEPLEKAPLAIGLVDEEFAAIEALLKDADRRTDRWVKCRRIGSDTHVFLPAVLIYREAFGDEKEELELSLGSGCAAAQNFERACLKALLEVIERDAVALWWCGGRQASQFDARDLEWAGSQTLMAEMRQRRDHRLLKFLDITPDHGIPVVAALSFDKAGRGFAAGFSAHPDIREAVRSALIEMAQTELGYRLLDKKRQLAGEEGLGTLELMQDKRRQISIEEIDALSLSNSRAGHVRAHSGGDKDALAAVVDLLRKAGHSAYVADLTRTRFAVSAVKVVVPGLQPYPGNHVTKRLMKIAAQNARIAASSPHARGIPPF